ncbi:MAG: L,D-transpeptidase [Bdellovibrionales bacterium]|nr:L,D-transpeptidase [Bdellovibrionales bacterium]
MVSKCLVLILLLLSLPSLAKVSEECESALKALFASSVSKSEASSFLKVQGDLTLHRMAWAYLKVQKSDQSAKLENVERTILTLLDEKYTSQDPEFKKARDAFEAQPLSRTALAEIGPYLKEVLSHEHGADAEAFILNASDLKLLHALSKFEKKSSHEGKFDSRMLARKSPEGMLNFAKLINSSYKTNSSATEDGLNVELKLQGLEKTIGNLQKKINDFIKDLSVPTQCNEAAECADADLAEMFNQNENIQNIFWDSLADKLESDDLLLDNLTFGELWLKTGTGAGSSSGPGIKKYNNALVTPGTEKKSNASGSKTKYTTTVIAGKTKVSHSSPVKEYYSSSTGYLIDDPIALIVKDDPRRKASSWKTFDPVYLGKMSDAIINDDKLFEINGQLYSRKTGKSVSSLEALKLLPPKKAAEFSLTLKSKDQKFISKQIASMVNGDKTFIYGTGLYDVNGKALNPGIVIAQEMSKKTGDKIPASRYSGMDQGYLIARADGLKNNKPHFKFKNEVFDSQTGRNLSSPFRKLASTEDVKINKERRVHYQNFSDKETIVNYHRDNPKKDGCQHYAIVDKANAEISVYTLSGARVFNQEVLVGVKVSDEKTKWTEYNDRNHQGSYTTGAGSFTIGQPKKGEYYSKNFSNNILQVEGQNVFAIHQVPNNLTSRYKAFGTGKPEDRRISQGCVNMKQSDLIALSKWIKPSCKMYVLPEEKNNKFVVKDGKIELVSVTPVANSQKYNYSQNGPTYKAININIHDPAGKTKDSVPFVKALEDEKSKLMKIFNLNNDDYNDLAAIAYGIMGNESNFGSSKKYWIKEHDQGDVIIAKSFKRLFNGQNPFDKSVTNTSRGFTQIKELPEGAWRKSYPEINKGTLGDPKNSAVSTIAYLVGAVRTLKSIAVQNAQDPRKVKITKENLVDYLGYIYQGRKGSLTSADDPANADFSTYVQKLRKNMSYIEISQKIE